MNSKKEPSKLKVETKDRELILTRNFEAPRKLLFTMWSDCKHLREWWGPKEWPMEECTMDFREGGSWHYCLRGPEEEDASWGKAIYKKITRPEEIVYHDYFSDEEGGFNKQMPEMLVSVSFMELNGKTRQVQRSQFDSNSLRDELMEMGVVEGMNSSLDRLETHLDNMHNVKS